MFDNNQCACRIIISLYYQYQPSEKTQYSVSKYWLHINISVHPALQQQRWFILHWLRGKRQRYGASSKQIVTLKDVPLSVRESVGHTIHSRLLYIQYYHLHLSMAAITDYFLIDLVTNGLGIRKCQKMVKNGNQCFPKPKMQLKMYCFVPVNSPQPKYSVLLS